MPVPMKNPKEEGHGLPSRLDDIETSISRENPIQAFFTSSEITAKIA
jgi:hypothetical protein